MILFLCKIVVYVLFLGFLISIKPLIPLFDKCESTFYHIFIVFILRYSDPDLYVLKDLNKSFYIWNLLIFRYIFQSYGFQYFYFIKKESHMNIFNQVLLDFWSDLILACSNLHICIFMRYSIFSQFMFTICMG